jgi:hypothetical protein
MLVVFILGALTGISFSQEAAETVAVDEEAQSLDVPAAPVPDNAEMALGFDGDATPPLPATFRGGDPDSGLVHCLEDVYYEKHEHSLIYKESAEDLAEGAKFESDPNITWDTKMKDADGNWVTQSSQNTNVARDGGKFFAPGEYQIGNSGARQVKEGQGGAEGTEGEEGTEAAEGEGTDGGSLVADGGQTQEGGETKTVTAQQSMGVEVHDITSPDMWIAFQEDAGLIDTAKDENALVNNLKNQVVERMLLSKTGRPFSVKGEDYEEASYIFIEEGRKEERDQKPNKKTARLSIAGPLFNERGDLKFESGLLKSRLLNNETQNRQVHVAGGPEQNLKGVFVRRNVPFIFAAMTTDNGDNRGSLADAAAQIEDKDGNVVKKESGKYLFRVPNFPREQYEDQPEYFFVAKGKDKGGNLTTVRMPLYVVNQRVAYEGGRNE